MAQRTRAQTMSESSAVMRVAAPESPSAPGFQRPVLPKRREGPGALPQPRTPKQEVLAPTVVEPPEQVASGEPEVFTFRCPSCERLLSLQREYAGKDGPCPGCSAYIFAANPWRNQEAQIVTFNALPSVGSSLPPQRTNPSPPVDLRHKKPEPKRLTWSPPLFPRSTETETNLQTPNPLDPSGEGGEKSDRRSKEYSGSLIERMRNGGVRENEAQIMSSIVKVLLIIVVVGAIYILKTKGKPKPSWPSPESGMVEQPDVFGATSSVFPGP